MTVYIISDRQVSEKNAKSVSAEKWKSYECISYFVCVSMKLQFHNT